MSTAQKGTPWNVKATINLESIVKDQPLTVFQKVIGDTFALKDVPREAYRIGLAGVVPYLATATATVVCSFEVANASENGGVGLFLSGHTAELGLHILEPLQVGYGAAVSTQDQPTMRRTNGRRSFLSSVPSTGVLSGLVMEVPKATSATPSVCSRLLSLGLASCYP
jgi:hypothetical protein